MSDRSESGGRSGRRIRSEEIGTNVLKNGINTKERTIIISHENESGNGINIFGDDNASLKLIIKKSVKFGIRITNTMINTSEKKLIRNKAKLGDFLQKSFGLRNIDTKKHKLLNSKL